MRRTVAGVYAGFWRLVELTLFLLCVTMVVVIFLQVVSRYLLHVPLSWSEELGRYTFAWVVMLGAAVAVHRDSHFAMRVLVDRLPPPCRRAIALAANATVLAVLASMAWKGGRWVVDSADMVSPAMQIRLSCVGAAIPFACALMSVEVVLQTVALLQPGNRATKTEAPGRADPGE